ncbi:MAG: Mur ligase family protein [Pseudomonadota bacterium]
MRVILHGTGTEARAAAAHFSAARITDVQVTDDNGGTIDGLKSLSVDRAIETVRDATYLRSPGVRPDHPLALAAADKASCATTPTGYWLARHAPAETITITGTKGKSTTVSLTSLLLKTLGLSASAYGNIGTPALNDLLPTDAFPIVEMSSYMLHDVPPAEHFHVITNLLQDHIDWHGGLAPYHRAKLRPFFINAHPTGLAPRSVIDGHNLPSTIGALDEIVQSSDEALILGQQTIPLQRTLKDFRTSPLRDGLRTALAIADRLTTGRDLRAAAEQVMTTYPGLPSRQEHIPSTDERIWINDALATVPEAVIEAVKPFISREVVLLIGGADRQQVFDPLKRFLEAHRNVSVIAFGSAGRRFGTQDATFTDTFNEALALASERCPIGGAIIFSPAAPSEPPYTDYKQRAEVFKAAAQSAS